MAAPQCKGFTLIEIIIATAIVAIMMVAVMESFNTGQDICVLESANLAVQSSNTSCLAEMTRMLRQAQIIGISADGMSIRFKVPVDWDADGDVLDDATDELEWGANDQKGWSMEYSFFVAPTEAEKVVPPFREAEEGGKGIDINRDGDLADNFERGVIVERFYDAADVVQSERQLTPYYVLTPLGNHGGDVNSDGVADPLFQRVDATGQISGTGENIRISFFAFKMANKERFILLHPTSIVKARNF
ncbi:MAG: prepilin-type N-terminal cleavage/methylation domain-containing protein [Planctomycetes bacterium]|nr:prepilin-type N-terminal cleavage/methylation domain-containing protein [Planctomycetota bacterium]